MHGEGVAPLVQSGNLEGVVPGVFVVELILGNTTEFRKWLGESESREGCVIVVVRSLETIDSYKWIGDVVVVADFVSTAHLRIARRIGGSGLTVDVVAAVAIVEAGSDVGDVHGVLFQELALKAHGEVPEARNLVIRIQEPRTLSQLLQHSQRRSGRLNNRWKRIVDGVGEVGVRTAGSRGIIGLVVRLGIVAPRRWGELRALHRFAETAADDRLVVQSIGEADAWLNIGNLKCIARARIAVDSEVGHAAENLTKARNSDFGVDGVDRSRVECVVAVVIPFGFSGHEVIADAEIQRQLVADLPIVLDKRGPVVLGPKRLDVDGVAA